VHAAIAPLGEPHREHDHYFRDLVIGPGNDATPWSFTLDVAGSVRMDEQSLELTLPGASFGFRCTGPHEHYWDDPAGGATPFPGPPAEHPDRTQWLVFTLGTPAEERGAARVRIEVSRDGALVETIDLPQSILEFGGVLYPPQTRVR
jgi:hypothetical protein